jgi:glycosyltransferase involved in cell wall biosynthesis
MRKILRIFIATPLGLGGRGGIDRLNDSIIDAIEAAPELNVRVLRLVTRGQGNLLAALLVFAGSLVRFWRAGRRREVDLLHIHLASRGSTYRKLVLGAMARRLRVPYVVHLHGALFDRFWAGAGSGLGSAIDRLFTGSAAIVVLGGYWARFVSDRLPGQAHKIIILPNATRPNNFDRKPWQAGRVQISFLGELGARKGTPQLIEALGKLAYRTDWAATIAGNGDIERSRDHARRLGIADRVNVPGWLDEAATEKMLHQSDIFVLPSSAENLPMAILEAFACGIAVVATPVGAVPEVIKHERNGLLVPVGNVDALANALRRLIDDPQLRKNLGETARRNHAERYEIGGYITRLTEIWRRGARS